MTINIAGTSRSKKFRIVVTIVAIFIITILGIAVLHYKNNYLLKSLLTEKYLNHALDKNIINLKTISERPAMDLVVKMSFTASDDVIKKIVYNKNFVRNEEKELYPYCIIFHMPGKNIKWWNPKEISEPEMYEIKNNLYYECLLKDVKSKKVYFVHIDN